MDLGTIISILLITLQVLGAVLVIGTIAVMAGAQKTLLFSKSVTFMGYRFCVESEAGHELSLRVKKLY